MPNSSPLQALEARREELRRQLAAIGDLRPGSLVARYRKCGKSYCHCAADESRGHGPSWSLTHPVAGKTRTRVIPPDAVEQTRTQIAECRRLRRLAREMIEVSEALCDARLAAGRGRTAEIGKKGALRPRSRRRASPKSRD